MTVPESPETVSTRRAVKVFEVSIEEEEAPFAFQLVFTLPSGKKVTHAFEAVADPGARGAIAIAALVRYTEDNQQRVDPNALMPFFNAVMTDEQFQRLHSMIIDKALTIPTQALGDVYSWLVTEYTGRPTQQPKPSQPGQ